VTRICSQVKHVADLSDSEIQAMFELFTESYDNVCFEVFSRDLRAKDRVFLFEDHIATQVELIGFSSVYLSRMRLGTGRLISYIFSGDTVIRRDMWGKRFLQRAFFRLIAKEKLKRPWQPLYWMLMSKGHKTYMLARRNFSRCYPNRTTDIPIQASQAMQQFYSEKFGDRYNAATCLIGAKVSASGASTNHALTGKNESSLCKDRVKASRIDLSQADREHPDIAFFLQMNPNFNAGVELACIAEVRVIDLLRHLLKYFVLGVLLKRFRTSLNKLFGMSRRQISRSEKSTESPR